MCHKVNSNLFPNDWAVCWYHDFGINREKSGYNDASNCKSWKVLETASNHLKYLNKFWILTVWLFQPPPIKFCANLWMLIIIYKFLTIINPSNLWKHTRQNQISHYFYYFNIQLFNLPRICFQGRLGWCSHAVTTNSRCLKKVALVLY